MKHDLKKIVSEILDQGYLMSLGTVDESGVWVSDVIYVHDKEFNLYWISDPAARHSQAIEKKHAVACTITVSNNAGELNSGLQIKGTAKKVSGDNLVWATQHRKKRGREAPKAEGEILEDGESWYMLQPTDIEIIYEKLFGFDKQVLKLK